MKYVFVALSAVVALTIACIAPALMYSIYHLTNPATEMGRIATVVALLFFGGGLTFGGAVLAFMVFIAGLSAALK